ncbi:MAG: hypothetical protein E4H41_10975 [Gemmatimonadales bacterium]|jgi:plastocyanin|nr:MAG: hypothetical protein E4H41_10975 [Gemmatimonadales bacterium]
MRIARRPVGVLVLALAALACGGEDSGGPNPPPPPVVGKVTVTHLLFKSDRNGTSNPAVDTVAAGTEVTWRWLNTTAAHSVRSNGSPSFASSALLTGEGSQYKVTFTTPGFYQYDCSVHAGMTGRIIVQ